MLVLDKDQHVGDPALPAQTVLLALPRPGLAVGLAPAVLDGQR
jgi:hypothetical protein